MSASATSATSATSPKITWSSLATQLPKTIVFPIKNRKPLNTPGLNKNNPMWGKFNPTLVTRGFAKNFSLDQWVFQMDAYNKRNGNPSHRRL
jgi:hypothetical protein